MGDMSPVFRILLVDDHPVIRAGVRGLLAPHSDLQVAGEAGTGDEAIKRIRAGDIDVMLLDISMPDKNGIDTLQVVRRLQPALNVLVMSGYPEAIYALKMMLAGARGYVGKDAPAEELIRAVRLVCSGRRYMSEAVADMMSDHLSSPPEKQLHDNLSKREFQVFRKLAEGIGLTQIGADLNLSVKTISSFRGRILKKMGLESNADLIQYAIQRSLLE